MFGGLVLAKTRRFVEQRFGLVLGAAFAAGLFFPGLDKVPARSVIVILAVIIFLSCFKVRVTDIRAIAPLQMFTFYLLRFVLLPSVLWLGTRDWLGDYALAIFLLSLMPAGVSAPAFASILGGNVSLCLALVVLTTLLTPLIVPTLFFLFTARTVGLDIESIFYTLAITVLLPIGLHFPFRRFPRVLAWMGENGSFLSVVLIGLTIALVIAKRRSIFLQEPLELFVPLAAAYALYAVYYLFGACMPGYVPRDRISLSLCSGTNNIALGISLAAVYFPPAVAVFLVLCELPWVTILIPYRWWVQRPHFDPR